MLLLVPISSSSEQVLLLLDAILPVVLVGCSESSSSFAIARILWRFIEESLAMMEWWFDSKLEDEWKLSLGTNLVGV